MRSHMAYVVVPALAPTAGDGIAYESLSAGRELCSNCKYSVPFASRELLDNFLTTYGADTAHSASGQSGDGRPPLTRDKAKMVLYAAY